MMLKLNRVTCVYRLGAINHLGVSFQAKPLKSYTLRTFTKKNEKEQSDDESQENLTPIVVSYKLISKIQTDGTNFWYDIEKVEAFFEKIAKFHELMGKMDNRDFGLALRHVRLTIISPCYIEIFKISL